MIVSVNGQPREVTPPAMLIELLDLPPGQATPRGIAVAVDGTVVPRTEHATTEVADGARIEIVTAVQGG